VQGKSCFANSCFISTPGGILEVPSRALGGFGRVFSGKERPQSRGRVSSGPDTLPGHRLGDPRSAHSCGGLIGRRQEPIRKSVKDVLGDLLAGHGEAALNGPESALKYLRRTLEGQVSMPNAVKAVAYDLYAEAQAQCGRWKDCAASVSLALSFLPDLEATFPHEYRRILEGMACFERGIQACTELGDFQAALNLCDRAIALKLGEHYEAKRDSLEWAR
jgi:hypothetical protein